MVYNRNNTDFNTQTNIRVNRDKKDLMKRKGYKLQDLLDISMNVVLNVEGLGEPEILKQIEAIDEQMRNLKVERALLVDRLNEEKEKQRDAVKNRYYEQLKAQYLTKWDFDETDDALINKVALTMNMEKIEIMNKIILECKQEAKQHTI